MSDGEAADFFLCRLLLLASRFPRALSSLVCLAALTFFGSVPRERLATSPPPPTTSYPPSLQPAHFPSFLHLPLFPTVLHTDFDLDRIINTQETNDVGSYVVGCVFISLILPIISHTGKAKAKVIMD